MSLRLPKVLSRIGVRATAATRGGHCPSCKDRVLLMLVAISLSVMANGKTAIAAEAAEFSAELNSFLGEHCAACHFAGASEGGLQIDRIDRGLSKESAFATWERIYDRVARHEMPPADSEQPGSKDRSRFLSSLKSALSDAHANRKGTVLRRLNRREYQNTLNDLFGTELKLEILLPPDGKSHGFDNIGQSLSLSMVHMQQYLDAIDLVLDTAIEKSLQPPKSELIMARYSETREAERFIGKHWRLLEDGAIAFFNGGGYPSGMLRTANAREAGRYRIRVTGYAYQTDEPVTFAVGATTFQRGVEKPTFGYFAFESGKPQSVELYARMERRFMVNITPWDVHAGSALRKEGIDTYTGPGLAILHVELEGPLCDEFPGKGHRLIFDGVDRREIPPRNSRDRQKSGYVPKFEIVSEQPVTDATRVLERIARAAFRRPVRANELERFLTLFVDEFKAEGDFEAALRTAIAAIFVSPDFLFLREAPGRLDDYALASRLSYFLTRTLPDAELLADAERGELADGNSADLLRHAERLLSSPHHERFISDFTDSWLNLRDIEFTSPDRNLFPEFDPFLQYSMLEETRGFVAALIADDAPVRNLVRSDFAMLNNRLARLYGIDGVKHPNVRRVTLPANSLRGGVLSQASVLKVSANGTNTSPVMRGVFVTERILGESVPPPPAGISGVEPDTRGTTTVRELLAAHRDSENCQSCHRIIDPPGFALECFSPIGGFRERFRSLTTGDKVNLEVRRRKVRYRLGPEVDATGELDGESFSDFNAFRALLLRDEDALARGFLRKLLTFATGREPGFSDRAIIERLVARSKRGGHGMRSMIKLVVASEIFRQK